MARASRSPHDMYIARDLGEILYQSKITARRMTYRVTPRDWRLLAQSTYRRGRGTRKTCLDKRYFWDRCHGISLSRARDALTPSFLPVSACLLASARGCVRVTSMCGYVCVCARILFDLRTPPCARCLFPCPPHGVRRQNVRVCTYIRVYIHTTRAVMYVYVYVYTYARIQVRP